MMTFPRSQVDFSALLLATGKPAALSECGSVDPSKAVAARTRSLHLV
jgi:hypothetical protein